jgi:hypothetical protein
MSKLIRFRKPSLRVSSKGLKLSGGTVRVGDKAGINISRSGISGSVQTGRGSLKAEIAHTSKKKSKPKKGCLPTAAVFLVVVLTIVLGGKYARRKTDLR